MPEQQEGVVTLQTRLQRAADEYFLHPDRLTLAADTPYIRELAGLVADDTVLNMFKAALTPHTAALLPSAKTALTADLRSLHTALKIAWREARRRARGQSRDETTAASGGTTQNRVMPFGMTENATKLEVVLPPTIDDNNNIVFRILGSSHEKGTQILSNGVNLMANMLSSEHIGEAPAYRLQNAGKALVVNMLLSECSFFRDTGDGNSAATMPPSDVLAVVHEALVAQAPRLKSRTAVPWLKGSTIVTTHGYDRQSGVWLQPPRPGQVYVFPDNPTEEERDAAVAVVKDIYLGGFKTASDADAANIIGSALMAIVQPGCNDRSPMVLINKPEQNSGGSWLGRILTMTATGAEPSVENWPEDNEEEQRKQLFAGLREQPAARMYDNVKGTLEGSALAIAAEARTMHGRVLGTSESATFAINCCLVFAGNGVTLDLDMRRRTNFINLEAFATDAERKAARAGSVSKETLWLERNHQRAVEALLTMTAWWLTHGMPRGRTLDSYEETTGIVGGILEACGIAGWLDNRGGESFEMLSDSDEIEAMFVRDLWAVFGAGGFECKEVDEAWVQDGEKSLPIRINDSPNTNARISRLGAWLKRRRGRYFTVVEGRPAVSAAPAGPGRRATVAQPAVEEVRVKLVFTRTTQARTYWLTRITAQGVLDVEGENWET